MDRREFIKILSAASLTATSIPALSAASANNSINKFLVVVNCSGGWDPTSLCDPKGLKPVYADRSTFYGGAINSVPLNNTKAHGDIIWSDIPGADDTITNDDGDTIPDPDGRNPFDVTVNDRERIEGQFDDFFNTFSNRMIVCNGVDNETNNHDTGNRIVHSGHEEFGYPNIAALYAGIVAPELPLSFISNGGYDHTASVVAKARANNASYINELAEPALYSADRTDARRYFFYKGDAIDDQGQSTGEQVDVYQMIKDAQKSRIEAQIANETLPLKRQQLAQLFTVRQEDNQLSKLTEYIQQLDATDEQDQPLLEQNINGRNRNGFKAQVKIAAAAFKAGLSASVQLSTGGFDTHGNHDNTHFSRLGDTLDSIHYLLNALEYLGIADKTMVLVNSDFGRTPFYNSGNGKDHWTTTSQMLILPTGEETGGKVIGGSDDKFEALPIDVTTGMVDENSDQMLTSAMIHKQIRKYLGIDQHDISKLFPLNVPDVNIFS